MFEKVTTVDDAVTRIIEWEIDNTAIFADKFMQTNVDNGAWAYWLLARGYVKHANEIIMELLAGEKDLPTYVLYEVYDETHEEPSVCEENLIKNFELIAEFLVESPQYLEKLNNFLENKEQ